MTECKHIVGYTDEGYEGLCNIYVGDEVYAFEDITLYAFCPLCGANVTDIPITKHKRKQAADSPFSPALITKAALELLEQNLVVNFSTHPEIKCGDTITIRQPVKPWGYDG